MKIVKKLSLNNRSISYWLVGTLLVIGLSACSNLSSATDNPNVEPVSQGDTYPAPLTNEPLDSYPAPAEYKQPDTSYPGPEPTQIIPTQDSNIEITPFKINKPVVHGTTRVDGSGPKDLPILLIDITMNGEMIAETSIDAHGSFSFQLEQPLEKGHRIGITTDELGGTKWEGLNLSDPGYFGDEYMLMPLLTFFYDTAMVDDSN